MKTIVVFKSNTGFTKRYGEWIAQELECGAVSLKEISAEKLKDFELVIYGGGFMAGSINGLSKMKKLYTGKLVVFATGATPQSETAMIEEAKNRNLTVEEQKEIPFFYMTSGLDYSKMNFVEKAMMGMLKKMLSGKKDKSEEEAQMAKMIARSYDVCDKKYIEPLVEYVRKVL